MRTNIFGQSAQRQNFLKSLQQYQKKGMLKVNQTQRRKNQTENMFVDLKNVWHTNSKGQQKQYQAIRNCQLFSQERKVTFVKFNYRNFQCKDLTYENVYNKLIKKKKNQTSSNKIYSRGTMNVCQLWSQKKLKQVLGNLPFPRDRLKVLKMYPKTQNNLCLNQKNNRTFTQA